MLRLLWSEMRDYLVLLFFVNIKQLFWFFNDYSLYQFVRLFLVVSHQQANNFFFFNLFFGRCGRRSFFHRRDIKSTANVHVLVDQA